MQNKEQTYILPGLEQKLILTKPVLDCFYRYRQFEHMPEAGGLLFAEFSLPTISIRHATPPDIKDVRGRFQFRPDRRKQKSIISRMYKKDLHLIGEWHTHPQGSPYPSSVDIYSMQESFSQSRHELNYLIMIIVGNAKHSLKLWVSVHNQNEFRQL